jgi:hypothetical protein
MPRVAGRLEIAPLPVLLDQSREPRPAQSGHLGQVPPQPDLGARFALESDLFPGLQKLPDLF